MIRESASPAISRVITLITFVVLAEARHPEELGQYTSGTILAGIGMILAARPARSIARTASTRPPRRPRSPPSSPASSWRWSGSRWPPIGSSLPQRHRHSRRGRQCRDLVPAVGTHQPSRAPAAPVPAAADRRTGLHRRLRGRLDHRHGQGHGGLGPRPGRPVRDVDRGHGALLGPRRLATPARPGLVRDVEGARRLWTARARRHHRPPARRANSDSCRRRHAGDDAVGQLQYANRTASPRTR